MSGGGGCGDLATAPDFAVVCSFLKVFGPAAALELPAAPDLLAALDDTHEVSEFLKELFCRLLRRAVKNFRPVEWEKSLIKFCHLQDYKQDAWELERFGFKKANASVKLKVLKYLLEYQFVCNVKFKAVVNKMENRELRLNPIGRDDKGRCYWMQRDHRANIRLYREDQDEETWELVASDRSQLVEVIAALKSGKDPKDSAAEPIINEDSNSVGSPVIPTMPSTNDDKDESSPVPNVKELEESDESKNNKSEVVRGNSESNSDNSSIETNGESLKVEKEHLESKVQDDEMSSDNKQKNDESIQRNKLKKRSKKNRAQKETVEEKSTSPADAQLEKLENESVQENLAKSEDVEHQKIEKEHVDEKSSKLGKGAIAEEKSSEIDDKHPKEEIAVEKSSEIEDKHPKEEISIEKSAKSPEVEVEHLEEKIVEEKPREVEDKDPKENVIIENSTELGKVDDEHLKEDIVEEKSAKSDKVEDEQDKENSIKSSEVEDEHSIEEKSDKSRDIEDKQPNEVINEESSVKSNEVEGTQPKEEVNEEKSPKLVDVEDKPSKEEVNEEKSGNFVEVDDKQPEKEIVEEKPSKSVDLVEKQPDKEIVEENTSKPVDLDEKQLDKEIVEEKPSKPADLEEKQLDKEIVEEKPSKPADLEEKQPDKEIVEENTSKPVDLDEKQLDEEIVEEKPSKPADLEEKQPDEEIVAEKPSKSVDLEEKQPEKQAIEEKLTQSSNLEDNQTAKESKEGEPSEQCKLEEEKQPENNNETEQKDAASCEELKDEKPSSESIKIESHKDEIDTSESVIIGEEKVEEVMIIKGEGNGADCESVPYFSEVIEEEVMFIFGQGSGYDCMAGNPDPTNTTKKSDTEVEQSIENVQDQRSESSNQLNSNKAVNSSENENLDSSDINCNNEKEVDLKETNKIPCDKADLVNNQTSNITTNDDGNDSDVKGSEVQSAPLPVTKRFLQNIPKVNSDKPKSDVATKAKLWTVDSFCNSSSSPSESLNVQANNLTNEPVLSSKSNLDDTNSSVVKNLVNVSSDDSVRLNENVIEKTSEKTADVKNGNETVPPVVSVSSNEGANEKNTAKSTDLEEDLKTNKTDVESKNIQSSKSDTKDVVVENNKTIKSDGADNEAKVENKIESNKLSNNSKKTIENADVSSSDNKVKTEVQSIVEPVDDVKMKTEEDNVKSTNATKEEKVDDAKQGEHLDSKATVDAETVIAEVKEEMPQDELLENSTEKVKSTIKHKSRPDPDSSGELEISNQTVPKKIKLEENNDAVKTNDTATDTNHKHHNKATREEDVDDSGILPKKMKIVESKLKNDIADTKPEPKKETVKQKVEDDSKETAEAKSNLSSKSDNVKPSKAENKEDSPVLLTVRTRRSGNLKDTKLTDLIKKADTELLSCSQKTSKKRSEKKEVVAEAEVEESSPVKESASVSTRSRKRGRDESGSQSEELPADTQKTKKLKTRQKKPNTALRKKVEEKKDLQESSSEGEAEVNRTEKKTEESNKAKPEAKKGKPTKKGKKNKETPAVEEVPVRQSRRIAQLKIKEEAQRRLMEEKALRELKEKHKKKTNKKVDEDWEEEEQIPSEQSSDDEKKRAKKMKKEDKKWKQKVIGWNSSSEHETESEQGEEDYFDEPVEEEDILAPKSDHEFSPESDVGQDESVPIRRARTLKKAEDEEEPADGGCIHCGKADHPEWILLCDSCDGGWHASCLKPVLFLIPEGEWFCPPCNHKKLILALEEELGEYDKHFEMVKSEDLKKEVENKKPGKLGKSGHVKEDSDDEDDDDDDDDSDDDSDDDDDDDLTSDETNSSKSTSSDEKIYRLRERRQLPVSYRFKEYDQLISSAIKEEYKEDENSGAGNQGRGKDISTIIEADKEEKKALMAANQPETEEVGEDGKRKRLAHKNRRKPRKLNSLEVVSDDCDDNSDEDFKDTGVSTPSSEAISSEIFESSSSDASSDDLPLRRSTRPTNSNRSKSKGNRSRRRILDTTSDSDDSISHKKKSKSKKSKSNRSRDEASEGISKKKKAKVKYGGLSDSSRSSHDWSPAHRTRQRKFNYAEEPNTESEDEVHKPSGKHMDSSDDYKQESDSDDSASSKDKKKFFDADIETINSGKDPQVEEQAAADAAATAATPDAAIVSPVKKKPMSAKMLEKEKKKEERMKKKEEMQMAREQKAREKEDKKLARIAKEKMVPRIRPEGIPIQGVNLAIPIARPPGNFLPGGPPRHVIRHPQGIPIRSPMPSSMNALRMRLEQPIVPMHVQQLSKERDVSMSPENREMIVNYQRHPMDYGIPIHPAGSPKEAGLGLPYDERKGMYEHLPPDARKLFPPGGRMPFPSPQRVPTPNLEEPSRLPNPAYPDSAGAPIAGEVHIKPVINNANDNHSDFIPRNGIPISEVREPGVARRPPSAHLEDSSPDSPQGALAIKRRPRAPIKKTLPRQGGGSSDGNSPSHSPMPEGMLTVAGAPQPFQPNVDPPSVITRMPHMMPPPYRGSSMYGSGAPMYGQPRPPNHISLPGYRPHLPPQYDPSPSPSGGGPISINSPDRGSPQSQYPYSPASYYGPPPHGRFPPHIQAPPSRSPTPHIAEAAQDLEDKNKTFQDLPVGSPQFLKAAKIKQEPGSKQPASPADEREGTPTPEPGAVNSGERPPVVTAPTALTVRPVHPQLKHTESKLDRAIRGRIALTSATRYPQGPYAPQYGPYAPQPPPSDVPYLHPGHPNIHPPQPSVHRPLYPIHQVPPRPAAPIPPRPTLIPLQSEQPETVSSAPAPVAPNDDEPREFGGLVSYFSSQQEDDIDT